MLSLKDHELLMIFSRSTGGSMSIQIPLQLQELYSDVRPNKNDLDAFFLRSVSYLGNRLSSLHNILRQYSQLLSERRDPISLGGILILDVLKKTAENIFWIVFAFGLGIVVMFFLIYLIFFWMPFSDLEI